MSIETGAVPADRSPRTILATATMWFRRGLLALLLVTTFVTTCYAGPIGVYLALAAALASLFFAFDRTFLARAGADWGVRLLLLAFFTLWVAFAFSARNGDDLMAFVDFLALPVAIPAFALLARHAHPRNVAIVSTLAALGCAVALANGLYEVHVLGFSRAQGNTSAIFFSNMAVLLGFFSLLGLLVIRSPWRWLLVIAHAFGLGAAILGGTRGAILTELAMLGVFCLYTLVWWQRPLRERIMTVAAIVLVSVGFVLAFFDMSRVQTLAATAGEIATQNAIADTATNQRLAFYAAAVQSFLESPLYGHGWWRRFAAAIPYMPQMAVDAMAHDNHAHLHNDILNFASAAGLIGVAAYLMMMAAPVVSAWRSPRGERWSLRVMAAAGVTVGYMTMGLTDTMFVFEVPKSMFILSAVVVMAFLLDAPPRRSAPA